MKLVFFICVFLKHEQFLLLLYLKSNFTVSEKVLFIIRKRIYFPRSKIHPYSYTDKDAWQSRRCFEHWIPILDVQVGFPALTPIKKGFCEIMPLPPGEGRCQKHVFECTSDPNSVTMTLHTVRLDLNKKKKNVFWRF